MADDGDDGPPPIRLMNFVSEDQLAEARKNRGPRVEDGTAQRDRPLFEILKENKDKKDAEFNERFKHRPPKALDEDETEFLDNLDTSRRVYERQIAEEEERYLRSFQAAVESQYNAVHELKETPPAPKDQDNNTSVGKKKNPPSRALGMVIKVKPLAKKAKVERGDEEETARRRLCECDDGKEGGGGERERGGSMSVTTSTGSGLVSYSDSDDDDDDD